MSKPKFNYRSFISIVMTVTFIVTAGTSLIIFLTPYSKRLREFHVIFGFLFIGFSLFHLFLNIKPLLSYIKKKNGVKKNRELFAALTALAVFFLLFFGNAVPPFSTLLDFSEKMQKRDQGENNIITHSDKSGTSMEIQLYKGKNYSQIVRRPFRNAVLTPQIAIWIETPEGEFIDTLYVTERSGKSNWWSMPFAKEPVQRQASLPAWSHRRGAESDKPDTKYLMPTENSPLPDSVSSATPMGNFRLNTIVNSNLDTFRIFVELNKSWDYNDYYTPEQNGEDVTLSHSRRSYSGQPAIIYSAVIKKGKAPGFFTLNLAGHSDPAGNNGEIFEDLSYMDSALEIVDLITVRL